MCRVVSKVIALTVHVAMYMYNKVTNQKIGMVEEYTKECHQEPLVLSQ